jgi:hypothetical protein
MRSLLLFMLTSCASAPAAPAAAPDVPAAPSASAPAASSEPPAARSAPADATASAPPPGPPPIGGSVLVGDINAPPGFDPKPAIVALKPKLLDCFNQARAGNPFLHGKITVRILVNEAGAGLGAEADPGGHAYDPVLVKCIDGVVKDAKFPKPGGQATVSAPLVFRP